MFENIWVKKHFWSTGPEGTEGSAVKDVLACQIVADVPSLHWAAAAEVQALAFFSR